MRELKVLLWIGAAACLLSIIGVGLPVATLETLSERVGGQVAFQDTPVFVYSLRVVAATYVAIGVFLVYLARAPLHYAALVTVSGVSAVVIGIVALVTGATVGMPLLWYLGDSGASMAFGAAVLVLQYRASACAPLRPTPPDVKEENAQGGL